MGSRGGQLWVETLALAALALDAGGHPEEGRLFLPRIVNLQNQHVSTQSTLMAIRAYTQLEESLSGDDILEIQFKADPGGSERVATIPTNVRPVRFERRVPTKANKTVNVSAHIDSKMACAYRLGCSYRVSNPQSSPQAPYRITQRITPSVTMESKAEIRVQIEPVGKPLGTQVVTRIGLPGGCVVDRCALDTLTESKRLSFWDVSGGYLDLYWAEGIKKSKNLVLPVRADIAGSFVAQPSLVYPYYESGKTYYASPLKLKVLNTFGAKVKLEDIILPGGKRITPGGRTTNPQGRSIGPTDRRRSR